MSAGPLAGRPGVAERLGIGPDECRDRNPRLVYGRVTGYGQDGPLAQEVGHDLNYIAMSGVLSMIGRHGQPPTPPLSLVGDFAGGGYPLALGVLAALLERAGSGRGQVVDASMVDGAARLGTAFFVFAHSGSWSPERGTNLVDSGAPYYDVYRTADDRWLSVAALEPHFYDDLVRLLELPEDRPCRDDRTRWPELRQLVADAVATRTRDQWSERAAGMSACIAPVLGVDEAPRHPHHVARGTFVEVDGVVQPAPAPRSDRTPAAVRRPPPMPGEHTAEVLAEWGPADDWLGSAAVGGAPG